MPEAPSEAYTKPTDTVQTQAAVVLEASNSTGGLAAGVGTVRCVGRAIASAGPGVRCVSSVGAGLTWVLPEGTQARWNQLPSLLGWLGQLQCCKRGASGSSPARVELLRV